MPDTELDSALDALHQSLGDTMTLAGIVRSLHANADRLSEPLKTMLIEAREHIDVALSLLEDRP